MEKNLEDKTIYKKVLGEIKGNKNIPIENSLNRTSIFGPWNDNAINSELLAPIMSMGKTAYSYELIGSRLDQDVDYPVLALIIKHWLNKRLIDPYYQDPIKVPLDEISTLFKKFYKTQKRKNYKWLDKSLDRLCTAAIYLKIKRNKKTIETDRAALLSRGRLNYDEGDKKYIEVEIGGILKDLYKSLDVTSLDITFMDLELLEQATSKNAKVLMRYLMTQRADFIEFSLPLLVSLIEPVKPKNCKIGHGRAKVKDAIVELQDLGFVTAYETNKVKGWDKVKIITSKVTTDKFIASQIMNSGNSNYDQFAWKRKQNKIEAQDKAQADKQTPVPAPTPSGKTPKMDEKTQAKLKELWDEDDPYYQ